MPGHTEREPAVGDKLSEVNVAWTPGKTAKYVCKQLEVTEHAYYR